MAPSCPAFIEISRLYYAEFLADDVNTQKNILPEYLDYHVTIMMWLRFITLEMKLCQQISQVERDVLLSIENSSFSIPKSIMLQLKIIWHVSI